MMDIGIVAHAVNYNWKTNLSSKVKFYAKFVIPTYIALVVDYPSTNHELTTVASFVWVGHDLAHA